jgi:hypothetical protein
MSNITGRFRQGRIGFSWTVLFFGFFVPLFRKDWKGAFHLFLASSLTLGLSNLIFAFYYNKKHLRSLLKSGYMPADEHSKMLLLTNKYIRFNQEVARR